MVANPNSFMDSTTIVGRTVSCNNDYITWKIMLKYVDTKIVFAEVPNEVTLAINILIVHAIVRAAIALTWQRTLGKYWMKML